MVSSTRGDQSNRALAHCTPASLFFGSEDILVLDMSSPNEACTILPDVTPRSVRKLESVKCGYKLIYGSQLYCHTLHLITMDES